MEPIPTPTKWYARRAIDGFRGFAPLLSPLRCQRSLWSRCEGH